jgi:hypothetical protein
MYAAGVLLPTSTRQRQAVVSIERDTYVCASHALHIWIYQALLVLYGKLYLGVCETCPDSLQQFSRSDKPHRSVSCSNDDLVSDQIYKCVSANLCTIVHFILCMSVYLEHFACLYTPTFTCLYVSSFTSFCRANFTFELELILFVSSGL